MKLLLEAVSGYDDDYV